MCAFVFMFVFLILFLVVKDNQKTVQESTRLLPDRCQIKVFIDLKCVQPIHTELPIHTQTLLMQRASRANAPRLQPSSWSRHSSQKPRHVSEAYAHTKRHHLETASRCEAAGVRFHPMALEALGGMTSEAAWRALSCMELP